MENKKQYTLYFEELKQRVFQKKLQEPSHIYWIVHIVFTIGAYIFWLYLVWKISLIYLLIYFYILGVELGFISHDLIHNQYFKNTKLNVFFSYICANFLIGLSRSWWMKKHNIDHHTFTNSDIHDSDIRDYDEIFTKNPGKSIFFHTHKIVLFWFATSILYFNLIFLSYKYILQHKKYGEFCISIWYFFLLPTVLFLQYWFYLSCLVLIVIYMLIWVHLAFVFMVNHIGMEIIDGKIIKEYSWLDLQTRTSRNIRGWWIVHHFFGWLNKQIEHHLFPSIPRNKIIAVAKETKLFCQKHGIRYHEVTFLESIKEIYCTLKTWNTM